MVRHGNNPIINTRGKGGRGPYEDLVLCVACDVGMIKSFNDIISPSDSSKVIVRKGPFPERLRRAFLIRSKGIG